MILSGATATLPSMPPNPWKRLADDWPHVNVTYADLGATWGITQWRSGRHPRIILHQDLNQVKRRCTIAHEIGHLERGAPCGSLKAMIERRVLDETATDLIPDLEVLAETVAVYDLRRAADELWVTFPVLVDRLNALSNEESLYVAHRRAERDS